MRKCLAADILKTAAQVTKHSQPSGSHNQKIEQSIIVIIQKLCRQSISHFHGRRRRDFEVSKTVANREKTGSIATKEEICEAILVNVTGSHARKSVLAVDANLFGNVAKGPIAHIAEELRWTAIRQQQQIDIATVVEVRRYYRRIDWR